MPRVRPLAVSDEDRKREALILELKAAAGGAAVITTTQFATWYGCAFKLARRLLADVPRTGTGQKAPRLVSDVADKLIELRRTDRAG